jgi:hypothetical protein
MCEKENTPSIDFAIGLSLSSALAKEVVAIPGCKQTPRMTHQRSMGKNMRKKTFDPTRKGIRRPRGTVNDPFEPKTTSCTKALCNVSSPTPSAARNVDHKNTLPPSSFDQKLHSKISSSENTFVLHLSFMTKRNLMSFLSRSKFCKRDMSSHRKFNNTFL